MDKTTNSTMSDTKKPELHATTRSFKGPWRYFIALGPAFIVASVVLGPGSILASTKVGAGFGLSMVWVLGVAVLMMMAIVALCARLGVIYSRTLCEELAVRLGRPVAVVIGLTIFLICACFQFGNNLGVLAAIGPWLPDWEAASSGPFASINARNAVLLLLNGAVIVFLFGPRRLYKPLERMMMLLVALMILGFFGNFFYMLYDQGGLVIAEQEAALEAEPIDFQDSLIPVFGLIGTTFSIAGAFYQSYLVREKGWGLDDVKRGFVDSATGIAVLGSISLVIMLTAAMSFYGRNVELGSVGDIASQLDPLFGSKAVILFSLGLFAGAFSSFLVNAMIGGVLLADGLGFGGKMDSKACRIFTTIALLTGMCVAMFVPGKPVNLIMFAQAMVVIGLPLLAASLLYLATRPELENERAVPSWMKWIAALGLVVSIVLASWTTYSIVKACTAPPEPTEAVQEVEVEEK
jgi:manganese transport protein